MKNLICHFDEKRFIKEMNDLTKTIIFLTNNKDQKTANEYKLIFYAEMLGFLEKDRNIDISDLLINLNIDDDIMYKLYNVLYNSNNIETINNYNIFYSYYKGYELQYINKQKILDKLFFIDEEPSIMEIKDYFGCEREERPEQLEILGEKTIEILEKCKRNMEKILYSVRVLNKKQSQ